MAIGVPGWPELACCTASIERVRIVLIQVWSSCAFVTMAPCVVVCSCALSAVVLSNYVGRFERKLERGVVGEMTDCEAKVSAPSAETPEPVVELEWEVEEAVGAADCSIEGEGQD